MFSRFRHSNNTSIFVSDISPQLAVIMSITKGGKLTIYIDCGKPYHPSHTLIRVT
jgi:hypothetical protein